MGNGERFPNLTGKEMCRILDRLCGKPISVSGSHKKYRKPGSAGETFIFGYHNGATVTGGIVRQILVKDVGLPPTEARKVV